MSIFDNVRELTVPSELNLLIKLKYGEPNDSMDYINSLPEAVILRAFNKITALFYHTSIANLETKCTILSIMMAQPANKAITTRAIQESLIEYHTLYG